MKLPNKIGNKKNFISKELLSGIILTVFGLEAVILVWDAVCSGCVAWYVYVLSPLLLLTSILGMVLLIGIVTVLRQAIK